MLPLKRLHLLTLLLLGCEEAPSAACKQAIADAELAWNEAYGKALKTVEMHTDRCIELTAPPYPTDPEEMRARFELAKPCSDLLILGRPGEVGAVLSAFSNVMSVEGALAAARQAHALAEAHPDWQLAAADAAVTRAETACAGMVGSLVED